MIFSACSGFSLPWLTKISASVGLVFEVVFWVGVAAGSSLCSLHYCSWDGKMSMMHAFLVVGLSKEERQKKAYELLAEYGVKNPTFVTSGKKHLIKDIRDLARSFFYSGADGEMRGVILENADLMTAEAANSFLKTF